MDNSGGFDAIKFLRYITRVPETKYKVVKNDEHKTPMEENKNTIFAREVLEKAVDDVIVELSKDSMALYKDRNKHLKVVGDKID